MNSVLTAFILAAGAAAFVYAKLGRRVGYGNGRNVWGIVAITFVLVFIMALVLFKTLVTL